MYDYDGFAPVGICMSSGSGGFMKIGYVGPNRPHPIGLILYRSYATLYIVGCECSGLHYNHPTNNNNNFILQFGN